MYQRICNQKLLQFCYKHIEIVITRTNWQQHCEINEPDLVVESICSAVAVDNSVMWTSLIILFPGREEMNIEPLIHTLY